MTNEDLTKDEITLLEFKLATANARIAELEYRLNKVNELIRDEVRASPELIEV